MLLFYCAREAFANLRKLVGPEPLVSGEYLNLPLISGEYLNLPLISGGSLNPPLGRSEKKSHRSKLIGDQTHESLFSKQLS